METDDKNKVERKAKTPRNINSSLNEHKNYQIDINNLLTKISEKTINIITDNDNGKSELITLKNIKNSLSKKIRRKIKRDTLYKNLKKLWEYQKCLLSAEPSKENNNIIDENILQNDLKFNKINKTNIDKIFNKLLESDSESDEEEIINDYSSCKNVKRYKNDNFKCDNNILFSITSSYKNINKLSKGEIITNQIFSKDVFRKIITFIKDEKLKNKTKFGINQTHQLRPQTNYRINKKKNKILLTENSLNTQPFLLNDDLSSITSIKKEISEEDSSIFDTFPQISLFLEDKNDKKSIEA